MILRKLVFYNLIFVNGVSSKSGGGKSILSNFCYQASKDDSNNSFVILVPDPGMYQHFRSQKIKIISVPKIFTITLLLPFLYLIILPMLLIYHKPNRVFNLSDIPIKTKRMQVFLFDWAYAVYPEIQIWRFMSFQEKIKRLVKVYFFKKFSKYIDITIAQTKTIRKRLKSQYSLTNVYIVPNSVSQENYNYKNNFNFEFNGDLNLLCLSKYYIHKNLESFIPLAKLIRSNDLNIKIIITISGSEHPMAEKFLYNISKNKLKEIIVNVGPVDMKLVPEIYSQTDGLILPTLLESFSGTYVEAMFHKKPIITSDLDFAHEVCNDSAFYFDPFDPQDMLNKILKVKLDKTSVDDKVNNGIRLLDKIPSWKENYLSYLKLLQ